MTLNSRIVKFLLVALLTQLPEVSRADGGKSGIDWCVKLPGLINGQSDVHPGGFVSVTCQPSDRELTKMRATNNFNFDSANEITCEIRQAGVRPETTAEEVNKKLAELAAPLKNGPINQQKLLDTCASLSKQASETLNHIADAPAYLTDLAREAIEQLSNCTVDTVIEQTRKLMMLDTKICKLTLAGYETTFKRVSTNKWLALGSPEGACNVVRVETLECASQGGWSYSSNVADFDRQSQLCQQSLAIELNKPIKYDHSGKRAYPYELQCQYLQ